MPDRQIIFVPARTIQFNGGSSQVATAAAAAAAAVTAASGFADDAAASAALAAAEEAATNGISYSPDHLFEFVDIRRRIIAFITTANTFVISRIQAIRSYLIGPDGREITDSADPDMLLGVADHLRRLYFSVRLGQAQTKTLRAQNLHAQNLNGRPVGSYLTLLGAAPTMPDATTREIVLANGQSLSAGTAATEPGDGTNPPIALTTDQPYGNLMFEGGIRIFYSADPTPFSSLVPHIEAADVGAGETILGGFQAMLMQLFNRCGYPLVDHPLRTVSASIGQGETAIALFRQGTGLFNRVPDSVTNALALLGGQTVKMRSHLWLQGESDGETTLADYQANLVGLAGEVDAAVRALTGQPDKVLTVVGQIDRPKIGLAQQAAARASPLVQIAGPTYWVEWAGLRGVQFDQTHRSAEGYKRLGACFAVAWFCTHVLKRPWRPLQLMLDARGRLDCRVDGADLLVRYEVPHGGALCLDEPIQISGDAAPMPRPQFLPQHGFYLFDDDGVTEKPVGDVVVEDRDMIRLLGCNPAANDILRVGHKDPTTHVAYAATNLRDRQGDVITFDDLGDLPVHNWAVIESHQLTAEELA